MRKTWIWTHQTNWTLLGACVSCACLEWKKVIKVGKMQKLKIELKKEKACQNGYSGSGNMKVKKQMWIYCKGLRIIIEDYDVFHFIYLRNESLLMQYE